MASIVLDSGVIIAVLDADDAHHDAAVEALRQASAAGTGLILPASAYAEVLVAPLRKGDELGLQVDAFIDALPLTVEPATREICRRAARLRAEHGNRLRLPDALVVATALELDAHALITTDARWPTVGLTVQVLEPR